MKSLQLKKVNVLNNYLNMKITELIQKKDIYLAI